ncbi:TetR/AcrR family transcriptional regulator [Mycobacterium sp.]|uniref:TetR/AcrR family transcriptional regulator n=1 Tax=Mycobacterium sp. TaxID=1785 RepID=UPI00262ED60D|nr:TetR/AcrR family transcriptional regulator [Mycobacterium sp.]
MVNGGRDSHNRESRVQRRILAVASEAFDRRGLRRTTMDEIAAAAGVARRTLYNYFENKAKLIGAVIEHESVRVAAAALETLDFTSPPEDLIVDASMALLENGRGSRYEEWLMQPGALSITAKVLEQSDVVARVGWRFWAPILEPLRDTNRLRVNDVHELIEWLTFLRIVLLSRPATFGGDNVVLRRMLRTFLVPALLRPEP